MSDSAGPQVYLKTREPVQLESKESYKSYLRLKIIDNISNGALFGQSDSMDYNLKIVTSSQNQRQKCSMQITYKF